MAGKELDVFEARELIRRLKMKQSGRSIASDLCISRETVKRYKIFVSRTAGYQQRNYHQPKRYKKQKHPKRKSNPLESQISSVLPFKAQVEKLLEDSTMSNTVILQRLKERGYEGSYSSIRRFVSQQQEKQNPRSILSDGGRSWLRSPG